MNPYKDLKLTADADKKQVIRHATQALCDKHYTAKTIADAQKTLFDPLDRAIAEFRYHLDIRVCHDAHGATLEMAAQPLALQRLVLDHTA